jgi:hypothetical protein
MSRVIMISIVQKNLCSPVCDDHLKINPGFLQYFIYLIKKFSGFSKGNGTVQVLRITQGSLYQNLQYGQFSSANAAGLNNAAAYNISKVQLHRSIQLMSRSLSCNIYGSY